MQREWAQRSEPHGLHAVNEVGGRRQLMPKICGRLAAEIPGSGKFSSISLVSGHAGAVLSGKSGNYCHIISWSTPSMSTTSGGVPDRRPDPEHTLGFSLASGEAGWIGGSETLNCPLNFGAYRASSGSRESGWPCNKFGRVAGAGRLVFKSWAWRARYRAANSSEDARGKPKFLTCHIFWLVCDSMTQNCEIRGVSVFIPTKLKQINLN